MAKRENYMQNISCYIDIGIPDIDRIVTILTPVLYKHNIKFEFVPYKKQNTSHENKNGILMRILVSDNMFINGINNFANLVEILQALFHGLGTNSNDSLLSYYTALTLKKLIRRKISYISFISNIQIYLFTHHTYTLYGNASFNDNVSLNVYMKG